MLTLTSVYGLWLGTLTIKHTQLYVAGRSRMPLPYKCRSHLGQNSILDGQVILATCDHTNVQGRKYSCYGMVNKCQSLAAYNKYLVHRYLTRVCVTEYMQYSNSVVCQKMPLHSYRVNH